MPRPRPDRPKLVQHRGVWTIVWYDAGQRRRVSTGETNAIRGQQALADFEAALEGRSTDLTVTDALDRYLKAKTGHVLAHDRLVEASVPLKASLGALRADQITQGRWDRYCAERRTRPRPNQKRHIPMPVSRGTLKREYNVLMAALRLAWEDKLLEHQPRVKAPAAAAPREWFLTEEECRRLIAAADGHVRIFVCLALMTGARRGAILALTWDRVNFATGMVNFQEPGRPLTKKRRGSVPMNDQLREELQAWRQQCPPDCEHVIQWQGRPVPTGLRWSFEKLCARAGLTGKPTPHVMKHSAASILAAKRIPIDEAADMLMTDPATLRKVYRHFDPDSHLRRAANALQF